MIRFLKYIAIFLFGFLVAKFWYEDRKQIKQQETIEVFLNEIKSLRKLVVLKGTFSELYNFSDTKKYFYDLVSFEKKAVLSVKAKVEVGYDLSKIDIQLDSLNKQIIINHIPEEELAIIPDITYFDLQQSKFNSFSKDELNKLNKKAIEKIKETVTVVNLQKEAKKRLFEELSKLYQLSSVYNWRVVNNTSSLISTPKEFIKH